MLSTPVLGEERVTTAHRARLAFIYVRQSTAGQVRQHQESTELQYRLADRALLLGWPRERVEVIDEDLGRSSATSDGRHGFQRLIAEIGLGKAGIVLSLDASRLARNNRDWHQLLELCSLFGVIIADGERLYDPAAYHDRLLLGLSGLMSEAELHQIRVRLHQGERQKAARGELRLPLPVGLARGRDGVVGLNPDEEVQARLGLVFTKFRELGSAKAVTRYLRAAGLALPVRPLRGPEPHEVAWQPADSARVLHILKNPAYAGAYVYGRRRQEPGRRRPGAQRCGTVAVPLPEWPVCLRDAQPGYIGWETYIANRKRLADNLGRYGSGKPGLPRKGRALLQGIAVCGRCGRRMTLHYSGPHGDHPVYRCAADKDQRGDGSGCQEVRALAVDAEVERLVLAALAPDRVALAVAALEELEEEARLLERQWSLKRERARYEAERARRQYDAVEPENRLVARSLERAWEERLRAIEQVEHDHERWRREQPVSLTEADQAELLRLSEDFPRVWHDAAPTPDVRKRLVRLVVQEVILDQKREPGQVWFKIVWQTGATSEHRLRRRVQAYGGYADLERLERRVRELNSLGRMDAEIAAALNGEGLVSARGRPFSGPGTHLLRKRWGIPTVKINGTAPNPPRWPDGTYSVQGVAAAVGITTQTVFDWIGARLLSGEQMGKGMPWKITLSEESLAGLWARVRRTRRSKREAS
jgi:DNA invertase Pin-like site-specific DNA recombinase